ncbi:prepilin peptidase [Dermatophilus congolensis]|uniref:prepilin peptidase n=1 Tax=Dermatophilus congolensis TaxID=1863 RepID=UPI001AAE923A|nr:prepilin peptidase [Dermatophilus congolensis]MBO3141947.1 hypothetical protein [Dermatophilus congolensis]MBO3150941.1 hypothetical protein [Dermatophilus congolensis]MBO3162055.1 hypothetical protein [Dermatophilus congolensis]MBO3162221.1 hypothetical protein [Dermatophilus congolensis]MBO3175779.1 hypothetical protein [Dermatophilus congolensis]
MLTPITITITLDIGFLLWAMPLTYNDVRYHRLPRPLTLGAIAVLLAAGILLWATTTLITNDPSRWHTHLATAAAGALSLRLLYRLLHHCAPSSLGRGDVTLALPLGAILGWHSIDTLIFGAWLGFAFSGITALALLLTRQAHRYTHIPHGPAMLIGAACAISAGHLT